MITTNHTAGRNLLITTLLLVSFLAVNSSEAAHSPLAYSEDEGAIAAMVTHKAKVHPQSRENCTLAEQLKDPLLRADYESYIAASQEGGFKSNLPLDGLSMECISCHDGVMAKAANYRIFDGKRSHRPRSIEMIKGAHPVGMDYNTFGLDKEYVAPESLAAGINLIDGKVGCTSCHNLLSKNEMYLVVDNSHSGLCLSCDYK